MVQFADRVVVVTGAGTGIGQATAVAFSRAGAAVVLVGRRPEKLAETARDLPAERTLLETCDVADRTAVNALATRVEQHFGAAAILVNNAGVNTNPRSVAQVDPAAWDLTVAVNLTGVFNAVRAFLPGMRQNRDGIIINIASIAGLRAGKLAGAAYTASKHGAVALTHSINNEEVDYGIRACAICPGEVATPILDQRPEPVSPQRRARMLQAEDVAAAVLFVSSLPPRACVAELVIKPTDQLFG
ncbi:MAG: SDR family NAD(P)-dependent oxidoreductase [Candidatus Latescibacteria bacterium]|nr:SDR family NAD(P)-dependent oxidoreductase [Candidatus Latescibacterota bacterium]